MLRVEEDQQRAHEVEQRVWDLEVETQQRACEAEKRVHEIEDIKQERARETQDAEQKHAIEDLDSALYTKNIKIKQMWEHVHVDARCQD